MAAWQQLFGRTVPRYKRGSLAGLRFIIGTLIGVVAGLVIKEILAVYPGRIGFGILYIIAFVLFMLSYILFIMIREPRMKPTLQPHVSLWDNLKFALSLIRKDSPVSRYTSAKLLGNPYLVMAPFLAIHARSELQASPAFLGDLTAMQMIGGIVGNFAAGFVADRVGPLRLMRVTGPAAVFIALAASAAHTPWQFRLTFLMFGFLLTANRVTEGIAPLEIVSNDRRSTALSLVAFSRLLGLLLGSAVSFVTWRYFGGFKTVLIATVLMAAAYTVLICRVPLPGLPEKPKT
jgi:MFS family permease